MSQPSKKGSGAPPPADRSGDPDELVDAWEFARIMGWESRKSVVSGLDRQANQAIRERARPAAAALADGPDPRAGRAPSRRVLRAVAEQVLALPAGTDPSVAPGLIAERLGGGDVEEVRAAIRVLATWPARRAPRGGEEHRLIPEPEATWPMRWRRRTVWEFRDGRRAPTPASRQGRFTPELMAAAQQAVLDAVEGSTTELLTAEVMDGLARAVDPGFSPAVPDAAKSERLEPARNLLTLALRELQASGRINLLTRPEIRQLHGLGVDELTAALRRPGAPVAVVQVNRFMYYRAEDAATLPLARGR